ncbi:MAG: hypothetical protein ACKO23_15300, partial [Gemmataceae bacterium]
HFSTGGSTRRALHLSTGVHRLGYPTWISAIGGAFGGVVSGALVGGLLSSFVTGLREGSRSRKNRLK